MDYKTLSMAQAYTEEKIKEAGGMTSEGVAELVKEYTGTEVNAYLGENLVDEVKQEIKSDNLLGLSEGFNKKSNGITASTSNQLLTLDGTWTATWNDVIQLCNVTLPAGDYRFSVWNIKNVTDMSLLYFQINNGNTYVASLGLSSGTQVGFTLKEETELTIYAKCLVGLVLDNATMNLMIKSGNSVTKEYVEYFEPSIKSSYELKPALMEKEISAAKAEINTSVTAQISLTEYSWFDGFVTSYGTESHDYYQYTDYIDISAFTTVKFPKYFNNAALAILYNSDKKYLRSISNTEELGTEYVHEVQTDEVYIRISCRKENVAKFYVHTSNPSDAIVKVAQMINNPIDLPLSTIITDGGMTRIFRTIGVVGDSLSSGVMVFGDATDESTTQYSEMYEHSWIQYMARYCGSIAYNFSRGGMDTKMFLEDVDGHFSNLKDGEHLCQAYFIALAHNDYNHSITIGTSADIDLETPSNNADSYYGNYARIIAEIKAVQPNAKIFCITCKNNDTFADYNTAIRYMAEIYDNVYVLEMDKYSKALQDWEYTQGHGNAMGYLNYSYQISSYVDWIIRNNREDFKYAQLIGTEYDSYIP